MSDLVSITSSMYADLTNLLKPTSSTQTVASNSKGLQLQDAAKIDDNNESIEQLTITNEKIRSYYDNLTSSGVLENIGNNTTASLSTIVEAAVGNGMSVQDACNIKNGITAYSSCVQNIPAVSVDVDA